MIHTNDGANDSQESGNEEWDLLWANYGLKDLVPLKALSIESLANKSVAEKSALDKLETLPILKERIGNCQRCPLCSHRTNIVFGEGNPEASLMFVGEAPGADEDAKGIPFVGRAGQLLTKIIHAMGLKREDIYIANVIKCRPPQNRAPLPTETKHCLPFLKAQIQLIKPQIIVTLGACATYALLDDTQTAGQSISKLRGQFFEAMWPLAPPTQILPTFHPSYLLRNQEAKKLVWEDMKKVLSYQLSLQSI